MLQQTTVTAVIPYYERFVSRFPTVEALAAAPLDTVLSAWAGLGYYARARNLHACAQVVAASGGFPADLAGLQALPGIGAYTAAAIGAIAFGIPAVPVDGNVERVVSRLFAIEQPMPAAKPAIREAAARLGADPAARARPSDFAQALFDLGASDLHAGRAGLCGLSVDRSMRRAASGHPGVIAAQVAEEGAAGPLWGAFLADRRPPDGAAAHPAHKGLLGGMTELPGTPWRGHALDHGGGADRCPDGGGMARGWSGAARFYPFRTDHRRAGGACAGDRGGGFRACRWTRWTTRRCRR